MWLAGNTEEIKTNMKIDNFQTFLDGKFETVLSSKCGDRQLEIKDKWYLVSLSSSQTTDY